MPSLFRRRFPALVTYLLLVPFFLDLRPKQVAVPQTEIVSCEQGHQSDAGTGSGLELDHLLILTSSSSMPELFVAQQPEDGCCWPWRRDAGVEGDGNIPEASWQGWMGR